MSSDPDSLTSGSITLPFTRSDLEDLIELETSVLRKRQAQKAAGASASAAPAAAEVPEQETAAVAEEVAQLAALISQGGGEDQWKELVQMHDAVLYNGLLAIMSVIPLPPPAFHTLVQSLYILATLDPACLYGLVVSKHTGALEKLLESISPELSVSELGARFRLLDLLLLEGAAHPELPPLKLAISFENVQRELMECVANASTSIFALAVSNMLLLDTLDSKRSMHRLLLAKQAELSSSSSSSSSATSPRSPAAQLSTHAFSRFSQELITLINAGRLPAQWEEEEEVVAQHSGTGNARRNSVDDLYVSTRTEVRALPDRDPQCHPLTSAALAFLAQLFATKTALDFLYTNDITVLVEVIIRRLEDQQENVQMTLSFLLCLSSIVSWPDFSAHPFKLNEIRALIKSVLSNYPPPPPPSESPTEAEIEERENRLAVHELAQILRKNVEKIK